MPKFRVPYPPEFRRQMVELVRSGRTPEELAREFESTFIEGFYNPIRRHSTLGYLSSIKYEAIAMTESN